MKVLEKIFNLLKEKAIKERGAEIAFDKEEVVKGLTKNVYFFSKSIRHDFYLPYNRNRYSQIPCLSAKAL